jgi:hypothetical protein
MQAGRGGIVARLFASWRERTASIHFWSVTRNRSPVQTHIGLSERKSGRGTGSIEFLTLQEHIS